MNDGPFMSGGEGVVGLCSRFSLGCGLSISSFFLRLVTPLVIPQPPLPKRNGKRNAQHDHVSRNAT